MSDPSIQRGPSNEVPALGYDPTTKHAVLPLKISSVVQDSTTGQWYGILDIAATISSSALPTGAATAANQTTGNASLSSIDGKITTVNTGAVTVASSALPTGAATSANQTTGNASLTSIDGKITAVNTGAVVVSSSVLPTGAALESGGNLATLAGIVSGGKGAVRAASGDFASGAIADLATLLTLAGTPSDANTVASLMGRLTKIRDLLDATIDIGGDIAAGNADSGNPVKVGGKYNISLPTLTDGQRGNMQLDSSSIQMMNLAYALSKDIDSVVAYAFGHSYTTITTATTTYVKSSSGVAKNVKILGGTLGDVTIYDNTAASGALIIPTVTPIQGQELVADVGFGTGLTIVTAAATIILIAWR